MYVEDEFLARWADETKDLFDGSFVPVYPYEYQVPRKEASMYDHTLTLRYRNRSGALPDLAVLRYWTSDLGLKEGDLGYDHVSFAVIAPDPNAKITNQRLREYHARSRRFGLTSNDARHAFRHAVLGTKVSVASSLTNAQLDKIFEAMGDGD